MSGQVTGGKVVFEDGVKSLQEYTPPKKASVELRFELPQNTSDADADAFIALVAGKAKSKVYELLGSSTANPPATGTTDKPARRSKAQEPAPAAATSPTPAASKSEPVADLSTIGDAAPATPQPSKEEIAAKLNAADEKVTDADLNNAAQKAAQRLGEGGPAKVKTLIKTYNPAPEKAFLLRELPADKRKEFLKKLDEIK